MTDSRPQRCTAFSGMTMIATGPLIAVALAVRAAARDRQAPPPLVFDDATGAIIDLDLRGSAEDIAARLAPPPGAGAPAEPEEKPARGRGRPKLGVVAREVTLLPRHWDWLAQQPGGASGTLRRLVDQARRADAGHTRTRRAREAAYRFLAAIAGDLPDFEEATRALFAGDRGRFAATMTGWPADLRAYALRLHDDIATGEKDGTR